MHQDPSLKLAILTTSCTTLSTIFPVCSGRSQTAPPETAVREKLAILEEDEPEAPLSKVLLEIRVSLPTVLFLLFRPAGDEGGNDMAMTSQDGHYTF